MHLSLKDAKSARDSFATCLAADSSDEKCNHHLRALVAEQLGENAGTAEVSRAMNEDILRMRQISLASTRMTGSPQTPAFEFKTVEERAISNTDLLGKPSVIVFWGLWCAPCRSEMPQVIAFQKATAHRTDFNFWTINDDADRQAVEAWLVENAPALPVLYADRPLAGLGVRAVPTAWFLDQNGRKVFELRGVVADLDREYLERLAFVSPQSTDSSRPR